MPGVITRGSFAKALWPGVNAWWGNTYKEFPVEYSKIFEEVQSSMAFEEEVGMVGTGYAGVKSEGGGISYDSMEQGFTARYDHVVWALGFIITREMYEDNQYAQIGMRKAKALAFSMRQTKEVVHANLFNRAFNVAYTYADGKPMISADRPNKSGGTWSNVLETPADLSEAALEQAKIDIEDLRNDRGLRVNIQVKNLIIHPQNEFNAARILKSTGRVGTDYNDINALKAMNIFTGDPIVNHYLTDPKAWFVQTNCPDGLKCMQRRKVEFSTDNDFDTENAKFKSTERYSPGMTDPRCIYGSPGA